MQLKSKHRGQNKTVMSSVIIVAVLVSFYVFFDSYWMSGKLSETNSMAPPETNMTAGTVFKVGTDEITLTADRYISGAGFTEVVLTANLNGVTQILKYDREFDTYEPIELSEVEVGDHALIYYAGPAEADKFTASLIQLSSPDDVRTVEELIKSLE